MKKLLLIAIIVTLSACSTTFDGSRSALNLGNPEPVKMRSVRWVVLPNKDPAKVVLGMDEAGYKNLSENLRDIMNFIILQRKVLDSYRNYYEPAKK